MVKTILEGAVSEEGRSILLSLLVEEGTGSVSPVIRILPPSMPYIGRTLEGDWGRHQRPRFSFGAHT